ncbi:MAG: hypothetical protein ACSHX0_13720 [Akkermansiaceae bacterium]
MKSSDFTSQDFIPKPCHENWFQMSGDERQRHCELCNTKVHNLTGMSYEDIVALKAANGGKLCGRLDPAIPIKRRSATKPLLVGSSIAALALASCEKDKASDSSQLKPPKPVQEQVDQERVIGKTPEKIPDHVSPTAPVKVLPIPNQHLLMGKVKPVEKPIEKPAAELPEIEKPIVKPPLEHEVNPEMMLGDICLPEVIHPKDLQT